MVGIHANSVYTNIENCHVNEEGLVGHILYIHTETVCKRKPGHYFQHYVTDYNRYIKPITSLLLHYIYIMPPKGLYTKSVSTSLHTAVSNQYPCLT